MWRTASQSRCSGKDRSEKEKRKSGLYRKRVFQLFPQCFVSLDELRIIEYNRVVKDLGGKTVEEFLKEVEKCFQVEREGACPVKPEKKGTFGLYVEKTWYRLTIKEEYKSPDPVKTWMYLFFRTVF